jgi:Icc-related predicted phosphoesterase
MKIALASDIHLEFGPIDLQNDQEADVLVLAGDICVADDFVSSRGYKQELAQEYRKFFDQVCSEFPHVIYILGNHEHYHGDAAKSYNILREHLDYPNLHILEKQVWQHQGHTFIGGTLWTDMNRADPLTLMHTKGAMNDFRGVVNSARIIARKVPLYERNPAWTEDGKNGAQYLTDATGAMIPAGHKRKEEPANWSPEDTVEDHQRMLDYINAIIQDPGSYIVVGHHAPSSQSVAEWFKGDTVMNGAFRSDLEEFIMDRPQIKLWVHGHMHNASDYVIGETRVVCNPRGYIGHEAIANRFELKYLEVK